MLPSGTFIYKRQKFTYTHMWIDTFKATSWLIVAAFICCAFSTPIRSAKRIEYNMLVFVDVFCSVCTTVTLGQVEAYRDRHQFLAQLINPDAKNITPPIHVEGVIPLSRSWTFVYLVVLW